MKREGSVLGLLVVTALCAGCSRDSEPDVTTTCPASTLVDFAIAVAAGEQIVPKLAVGSDGHVWASWYSLEGGNYNVRAQRLDRTATPMLDAAGLLVSNRPSSSWVADYSLAVQPDGSAILAFSDVRNGDFDAFAYKLTPAGQQAWGADGVALGHSSDDDFFPRIALGPDGAAVFLYERLLAGGSARMVLQRLLSGGRAEWGEGVILGPSRLSEIAEAGIVAAENGAVILVWLETPEPLSDASLMVARKLDARGQSVWPADVILAQGETIPYYAYPSLEPDGAGGVFVAWMTLPGSGHLTRSLVQHVDRDGRCTMPVGGARLSLSATTSQWEPSVAYASATGELIALWSERDADQKVFGLRAQRLASDGTRRWGDLGLELVPTSKSVIFPIGVRTTADAALVAYQEVSTSPAGVRMMGARVPLEGTLAWNPVALSQATGEKAHPELVGRPECGLWLAWDDHALDAGDIRAAFLAAE